MPQDGIRAFLGRDPGERPGEDTVRRQLPGGREERPLTSNQISQHLDLDFSVSRTVRKPLSPLQWYFVMIAEQNETAILSHSSL